MDKEQRELLSHQFVGVVSSWGLYILHVVNMISPSKAANQQEQRKARLCPPVKEEHRENTETLVIKIQPTELSQFQSSGAAFMLNKNHEVTTPAPTQTASQKYRMGSWQ